ncbi:MAG: hypothetical protein ACQEQG_10625 [Bacillota bacterium]
MTGNKKYRTNTSDSEFLQGVYQKIDELQAEEKEMEKIRTSRRKIWKKKLIWAFIFLLINLPFAVMLPEMIRTNNQPLIYGWSFLLITSGSYWQYSLENKERC